MTKLSHTRAASLIAAGALATAALISPATAAAGSTEHHSGGGDGGTYACKSSSFTWDVKTGRNDWAMTTVHISAKGVLPANCTLSFSLNAYSAEGSTWPTSGTQALLDHQSITLSKANPSGTLTVAKPRCYGQTDLYTGTTKFDGLDGKLPHYPNVVTPTGLISYSNGGAACESPSSSPSQPVESEQPSTSPSQDPSTTPSNPPSTKPSNPPSTTPSNPPSTTPSNPPSTTPSNPPSTTPSNPPSTKPSNPPSTTPSNPPSTKPSTEPSGSVLGATGAPQLTPPPTDTTSAQGTGSGSSWQLLILAIGTLAASLIVLTPAKARKRG